MRVYFPFFLAMILGLGLIVQAQSKAGADARGQEIAQVLVRRHSAWKAKLIPPGVSLEAQRVSRQGDGCDFHLFVTELSDVNYQVVSWPVSEKNPSTVIEGASLGKDGIVMCAGRNQEQCGDPSRKDDPIEFTISPAQGEPLRLALLSGNGKGASVKAAIVIVPYPISAKDKGCTLNVERWLSHFDSGVLYRQKISCQHGDQF
jgi:hypothetical protein